MRRADGNAAAAGRIGVSIRLATVVMAVGLVAAMAPAVPAAVGLSAGRPRLGLHFRHRGRNQDRRIYAYYLKGCVSAQNNDHDKAIADFTTAIRLDPRNVEAHDYRAVAWIAKDELDKALADLDAAIGLDPQDGAAFSNRGAVWQRKGRHDRAIADFNQAIRLDPDQAMPRANRGAALVCTRQV